MRRYSRLVPRSRLTPSQRRDQLLDVAAELFSSTPFAEVSLEDVAARADVSRALAYHYFPSKKELFAAVWKRAHDELLTQSTFDGPESLLDQIQRALVAHYAFYERNAPLVFIANRTAVGLDPVVREPITHDLNTLRDRVLDAAGVRGKRRAVVSAALAGWIAFVREVAVEWLARRDISRKQAIELCMAALSGALGDTVELTAPPVTRT